MLSPSKFRPFSLVSVVILLLSTIGTSVRTTGVAVAQTSTTILHLAVQSARAWVPSGLATGQAIPHYRWLVVEDDTGDASRYGTNLGATDIGNSNYACKPPSQPGGDPAYPANCQWPGIHSAKGGTSAQVIAQGDETTLNLVDGIDTALWPNNDHNPNRSYMISVIAEGFDVPGCTVSATNTCHVDGFKIDGQWFTTPFSGPPADLGVVKVGMQPYPLPLTTVRMKVWNDLQTNSMYDTGEPNLAGFEGHISDVLGPVTTDWYGNPVCTVYQHDAGGLMTFGVDGKPLIQQIGGHCYSDADGVVSIKYLGPNRYVPTVTAPSGQEWFQTSTLEGWHDYDTWAMEGWDGYDPEFVQGAEPFPFAQFGFVQRQSCGQSATNPSPDQLVACPGAANFGVGDTTKNVTPITGFPTNTGSIKGNVVGAGFYSPQTGGLVFGNGQGNYIIEKIKFPLVSLLDLTGNDNTIFMGKGDVDGAFEIKHVPDGDYVATFWDEDQGYIIAQTAVSVQNGQTVDMGVVDLTAWWSRVYGKVCFDTNRNGRCDTGEPGMPNLALNLLDRDNKVAFYGDNTAKTDSAGNYIFKRAYPLGKWVVTQGYWEQFYTTGVTFQTDNQPTETVMLANGGFVDVSTFTYIGHNTRMDWAIHTYETNPALGPTNGGIVGEVLATTTRNELDARMQAQEPYEPGLPDATVRVFYPVKCDVATGLPTNPAEPYTVPVSGTACTQATTPFGTGYYLTDVGTGAFIRGPEAQEPYTSETFARPTDCTSRDAAGVRVVEQFLPAPTGGHDCIEAPMMANQVGDNTVGPFMQVNGNFGFVEVITDVTGAALPNPISVPPGDYLVVAESATDVLGNPTYDVVKEEDVNIFSGDQFVAPGETPFDPPLPNRTPVVPPAPAIPPFPCAGPMHTVNVVDDIAQAHFDPRDPSGTQGVYNPDFFGGGGSPYEGQKMPLCDTRLVTVRNGRSSTPLFHMKPQVGYNAAGEPLQGQGVPLPGRIMGLVIDDLNLSANPKELMYGEKYGIPNMPIGIYDFSNRLVKTIQSDPFGLWEVILPSTSSYNCPLPAGPCPGTYRFLANDPGTPGHPNANYIPSYRTIAAVFEVWPGVSLPADLAPTSISFGIFNPATQTTHMAACLVNDPANPAAPLVPELFTVNVPYVVNAGAITLNGQYFRATQGTGQVTLDNVSIPVTSWSDQQIVVNVPATIAKGPHQLKVTAANGQSTINGLTVHVRGTGYNPTVIEVGPGRAYDPTPPILPPNPTPAQQAAYNSALFNSIHAVQRALDAAAITAQSLVVVYPNAPSTFNPFGSYFENLIMHSPVKLQGVGPGGVRADGTHVLGSVLDGLGFGTDGARDTDWATTLNSLNQIVGPNGVADVPANFAIPIGSVILAVATSDNQYGSSYKAAIDGFTIQNGDLLDFVPNTNNLGTGIPVSPSNNTTANANQGGGITAFASTRNLQITNNLIHGNAGAYAGAIRLGTPDVGDNNLDNAHIAFNRITNNGGTNIAGALGVYGGTPNYEINNNDICGNFSAEYGGGIAHFGLSGNSNIHDNRVYFNASYDEGGGIMVTSDVPATPTSVFTGSGAVNIYNNIIQGNLSSDDGGGLRFLMAGSATFNVYNNIIVNNISTHEGGGVAIDNAPNVRFFNNTVMKNMTTATAATSNGQPAPAGLSTSLNNRFFQATLPSGSPLFSNPLLFNNIFWDNRAGTWNPTLNAITGIGGVDLFGVPDPNPINRWDMAVPNTANLLSPTNSVLQTVTGTVSSPTNVAADPQVVALYTTTVSGLPWRGNPRFVSNILVAEDVPASIMGDYHLRASTSPAFNLGAASKSGVNAPTFDIDLNARPANGGFESGADELFVTTSDLSISKTDNVTSVNAGTIIRYTIVVGNSGPNTATLASVVDTFPSALLTVTWTCTGTVNAVCGAASGSGNINTTVNVPAAGAVTFVATATVAINAVGNVANTATVSPAAGAVDPNLANNSATDTDTVVPAADVSITKTDGLTTVAVNGQVRYTIRVSNSGPAIATSANVVDNFPAALTGPINWTCTASAGSNCNGATGTGNINRNVVLAVGGVVTFATTSGSVSGSASGALTNNTTVAAATGTTDPNLANNIATDSDTILGNANLSITKTDGTTTAIAGSSVRYTITVGNAGPSSVVGAQVTDTFPATISGVTWTCTATAGSACGAPSGTGNIATTASLNNGGTVTYIATGTLTSTATGSLTNTATVGAPVGITDGTLSNNTATDVDTIALGLPPLSLLDNFNRATAPTLGITWSQGLNNLNQALLRLDSNQANGQSSGTAIYSGTASVYGSRQGAAFTFANTPLQGTSFQPGVILKATGGTSVFSPTNYLRVTYLANTNQVLVQTTNNGNVSAPTFTTRATFAATFANGNTFSAVMLNDGTVNVFKTSGATTTLVGTVTIGTGTWAQSTGGGRIGLQLSFNTRADDFRGGNVP